MSHIQLLREFSAGGNALLEMRHVGQSLTLQSECPVVSSLRRRIWQMDETMFVSGRYFTEDLQRDIWKSCKEQSLEFQTSSFKD